MAVYTMKDGIVDRALLNMDRVDDVIPTGFNGLDEMIEGGLQNGYLYVLGGRPSIGKTAFALNIAEHILGSGRKVLYYSLQMEPEKLIKRMIKMIARGDVGSYREAADILRDYDFIVDTDSNIAVLSESIKERVGCDNVSLVIVDDLAALSGVSDPSGVCRFLKNVAMDANTPIMAIANASGSVEERYITERRPILSDLYDTYNEDTVLKYSDVIMLLYRDEYYDPDTEMKGIAEINVAKNISGPVGTFELAFIQNIMKYANLVRE